MSKLKRVLQRRLGDDLRIDKIMKGYSTEQKYSVTTPARKYLVRVSQMQAFDAKKKEFSQMKDVYGLGVRCNEPVALLVDEEIGVIGIYSWLPGEDAEDNIANLDRDTQYEIGVAAGRDLRAINSVTGTSSDWKDRKWAKHERYVRKYREQGCRFNEDDKVLRFIETHYDPEKGNADRLQHDDFHLGNILVNDGRYAGVLDFNRYDWGDPLHEFVKLEWFSWPISREYSLGQVTGYFGRDPIGEKDCKQIAVYVAMSIVSTIIWTQENWPENWAQTDTRISAILHHYRYFDSLRPQWAP